MSHKRKRHQHELKTKKQPWPAVPKRKAKTDIPDENVFIAILRLPKMKNSLGICVRLPEGDQKYLTALHISSKRHKFRVVDIEAFPGIIADRRSATKDQFSKKATNYVGKRPGNVNVSEKSLKIVTEKQKGSNDEIIVTAYPVKKSR